MSEVAKRLGNCIYKKRKEFKLTQAELAERSDVTEQTIRKIEHGEGNPQLDVLCSLITALCLNPTEIFYPQQEEVDPARKQLEFLLTDCNDDQIHDLLPVVEAALGIVKGQRLNTARR